jgi:dGTP triphosphohydrolase
VLADLMSETGEHDEHDDYGSFEGNAQSFRVVTLAQVQPRIVLCLLFEPEVPIRPSCRT